jgi:YggT family protein
MGALMRAIGALTSVYMIMVFLRVMLTWFSGVALGKPYELLSKATDPYLHWFRRFPALRTENMDFSPIVALASLSIANNIFVTIGTYGKISIGIILSMVLSSVWSAAAFLLMLFAILIGIRLISQASGRNSILPIWRAVDALIKPVLYRINRIIYKDRLVTYKTGMISAVAVLIGGRLVGGILFGIISGLLARLPF